MHGSLSELLLPVVCVLVPTIAFLALIVRTKFPNTTAVLIAVSGIALLGPNGFGLIEELGPLTNHENILPIFEMILFVVLMTLGIQYNAGRVAKNQRVILLGGGLQLLITAALCGLLYMAVASSPVSIWPIVVVGVAFSLSSTMVPHQYLEEHHNLLLPQGRLVVNTLLAHDIFMVPFFVLLSFIGGGHEVFTWQMAMKPTLALLFFAAVLYLEQHTSRRVFDWIAGSNSPFLFVITVFGLAATVILICSLGGLSLPIAGFLTGILISGSKKKSELLDLSSVLERYLLPMFFVLLALTFNGRVIAESPGRFFLGLFAFLPVMFFGSMLAALIGGRSLREAIRFGGSMAQLGELSLVVAEAAHAYHLVSENEFAAFFNYAVIYIALYPLTISCTEWLANRVPADWRLHPWPLLGNWTEGEHELHDHIVVVNFNISAQMFAALASQHRTVAVVEDNSNRRRQAFDVGRYYIPDTRSGMVASLNQARIDTASLVVICTDDLSEVRHILSAARALRPDVPVIIESAELQAALKLDDETNPRTSVVDGETAAGIELYENAAKILGMETSQPTAVAKIKDEIATSHGG